MRAMGDPVRDFELFFDESGDFLEAAAEADAPRNRPASQLVGLLAPKGVITRDAAEQMLQNAAQAAGVDYDGYLHATESGRADVEGLVASVLPQLRDRRWQPVRIANKEGLDFGDKRATYTNLVAELALRCLQQLARGGRGEVVIHLCPAGVKDPGLDRTYKPDDYLPPIREAMARASVRAGLAATQRQWRLSPQLRFLSGQRDPEIFLCDLLSNASYRNFRRLPKELAAALKQQFGAYDFSLALRADVEQIEAYCEQSMFGMAAAHLAERFDAQGANSAAMAPLQALAPTVVRGLANLGAPMRDAQWAALLGHIEQTIQSLRELEKGRRLCAWVRDRLVREVARELGADGSAELDWVRYALGLHMLVAANHGGDLLGARSALTELHTLQTGIVRRFEHVDLFLQAQVHEAVHHTDCREFAMAMAQAERVATFHRDIGELLQAAMPDALPRDVRAARCGQAFGTAMQAAMYASAAEPSLRARAEAFGDNALAEFDNEADRSRQFQYRCQLATIAGDVPTARSWLAKALGCQETTPAILAPAIAATPAAHGQAFLVLHWLRLVATAHRLDSRSPEAVALAEATAAAKIQELPCVRGVSGTHPGPTILRYLGEVDSLRGDWNQAFGTLRRLVADTPQHAPALSALPAIALQARLAADAMAAGDGRRAKQALAGDGKDVPGLIASLAVMRRKIATLPAWEATVDRWASAAQAAAAGGSAEAARRTLAGLGAEILY